MERELCAALAIPFPERPEGRRRRVGEGPRGGPVRKPRPDQHGSRHLDYFGTGTHFSGHRVVLFGFDDEAGDALCPIRNGRIPSGFPYLPESGAFLHGSAVPDGEPLVRRPARGTAARPGEGDPPGSREEREGDALPARGIRRRRLRDSPGGPGDRPLARNDKEWSFAARFGYQVIEKRGTGGGFFRRLYARYLEEASSHCPPLAAAGLAAKMGAVADGWTEIAAGLREISESPDPGAFRRMPPLLLRQADMEEAFWREVASLV